MYEWVYVRGGRQQQVIPPFVVADVETAILIHPEDKLNVWGRQREEQLLLPNIM